uniref:Uncharacterized protein n=1 Tax=Anguilla anguilla TaxID=7936 RepID=A0A0E9TUX4_ANGAN
MLNSPAKMKVRKKRTEGNHETQS